jgi:tetratricopeptide (TPR) repeat protein
MAKSTHKPNLQILQGGNESTMAEKDKADQFLDTFLAQLPDKGNPLPFLEAIKAEFGEDPSWQAVMPRLDKMIEEAKAKQQNTPRPTSGAREEFASRCNEKIEEADQLIARKDMAGAAKIIFPLLEEFEMNGFYDDKKGMDLCSPCAPYEFPLFLSRHYSLYDNDNYEFVEIPVSTLYAKMGAIVWAADNEEMASDLFEQSIAWNPVSAPTYLMYAALEQSYKHYDKMLTMTKAAHQCAVQTEIIAHCFLNYGTYYQHRKKPLYALAMFRMARKYFGEQKDENLDQTIRECEKNLGKIISETDSENEAREICRRLEVSFGISEFVASVICTSVEEGIKGDAQLPLETFGPMLEKLNYEGDEAEIIELIAQTRQKYAAYKEKH